MTFVPHFRLTMLGTLGAVEQFSMSISLEPQGSQWQTYLNDLSTKDAAMFAWQDEIDAGKFDDLRADCRAWFGRESTHITQHARLTRIKFATIGADGKYTRAPKEWNESVFGYDTFGFLPFQCSRKTTLLTDGDLGRVKGGFYIPCPSAGGLDPTTDQWSAENSLAVQGSTLQLVEDINNDPGLDDEGFRVVVASQGRHNDDGSVRRPPTNHDVIGVSVGRRVDVQRRRANKISESRPAAGLL